MKRQLEEVYEEIKEIRVGYSKKMVKLKEEYQEMIDSTFKKAQDVVNKDREKYITMVKDWVRDYVENNRGKEDCDKYHSIDCDSMFRRKTCIYETWYIIIDDEKFTYYICSIIVPPHIRRIAKSLSIPFTATYYISNRFSDMYGEEAVTVSLADDIKLELE